MKILKNYPLSLETTFGCGGRASFFVAVENLAEFFNILTFHDGKFYVLGAGSKTLCQDGGYDGLVISTKHLNSIKIDEDLSTKSTKILVLESGVTMLTLNRFCVQHGLGGLEWTAGIPASVGGAVSLNASSFGHEFSESVVALEVFEKGKLKKYLRQDLTFSYHKCHLKFPIFRIWIKTTVSSADEVLLKQSEYWNKKYSSQPIDEKSAGSVFMREENLIPSKTIDKLGLKGVKIGGAMVSKNHAGFIVNTGTASSTDILNLIDFLAHKIEEAEGIMPRCDIIIME